MFYDLSSGAGWGDSVYLLRALYTIRMTSKKLSRYLTTWICFLYQHLKEIDWMPSVEQVEGTLPHAFKEKYESTYAIIDGSEIFTCSHRLGVCTNITIPASYLLPVHLTDYVSPLYVGSISDVELTQVSGFLTNLEDKSIMADRGFTIKDMLSDFAFLHYGRKKTVTS